MATHVEAQLYRDFPVFYSTNTWLKYSIQREYRKGVHYVWCGESFDGDNSVFPVPRASSPGEIYRELLKDVQTRDRHSAKIAAQRATLLSLATEWASNGELSPRELEEVAHMVKTAEHYFWRPVIFIIPRSLMGARAQLVPIEKRGGFAPEYVIPDLKEGEFDAIEPIRS
jgi:hypothetical protein